jgi:hypothetical protein
MSDCVNLPGFRYITPANNVGYTSQPGAAACTTATYSVGLKKQQSCDRCPSGYEEKTGTLSTARTSSAICTAPAGWYVKSPGVVAPCPKGEYKSVQSLATSCTACGEGISTVNTASTAQTACVVLLPGYKATLDSPTSPTKITATTFCPQKSYCPGYSAWPTNGDAKDGTKPCPGNLWTKGLGAKAVSECREFFCCCWLSLVFVFSGGARARSPRTTNDLIPTLTRGR